MSGSFFKKKKVKNVINNEELNYGIQYRMARTAVAKEKEKW